MTKTAFITGATAGIGKACAEKLAQVGFDLILCGRRNDRLLELKNTIVSKHQRKVLTIEMDVRNRHEVKMRIESMPEEWKQIGLLVNNAGLAVGMSAVQEGIVDDWERMIDTNLKGLLYVTREVGPLMINRKQGHIINISSIAGKEVYPGGNVYCATKHAVDALTKGMRIDMLPYNIKVTSIAPGMVDTEFSTVRFKGDVEKANRVYQGFVPLQADDIAETVEFVVTRPNHVTINDILIMPTAQANARDVIKE